MQLSAEEKVGDGEEDEFGYTSSKFLQVAQPILCVISARSTPPSAVGILSHFDLAV